MFVLLELTLNPPEGILAGKVSKKIFLDNSISLGPKNEENFFEWEALIT